MANRLMGQIQTEEAISGGLGLAGYVGPSELQKALADVLIAFGLAPVMLDKDGALLADADGSILIFEG